MIVSQLRCVKDLTPLRRAFVFEPQFHVRYVETGTSQRQIFLVDSKWINRSSNRSTEGLNCGVEVRGLPRHGCIQYY